MKKEYIKYLIPVVAILVIIESVILVDKLTSRRTEVIELAPDTLVENEIVTEDQEESVMELVFEVNDRQMEVGQSYVVNLSAVAKMDKSLDAVNVYVNYDPTAFEVSDLTKGEMMPEPIFMTDSEKKKGLLVANYYVNQAGGFKINKGQELSLLSFEVTPLKKGSFELEINAGNTDKESVTMFVESMTSKILPYGANNLEIEVK